MTRKNLIEQKLIMDIVSHTDLRIKEWYSSVKEEYGVVGCGKTHYNKASNSIVVEYVENGEQNTWKMAFYPEYIQNGLNWVFNCWSELA